MLINCLILSISVTVDALGIGITYGLKNTKLPFLAKLILFGICFLLTSISVFFGETLKNIFTEKIATLIGSTTLIIIGIFVICQAFKKKENKNIIKKNNDTDKVFSIFLKWFGITIKIIKDPMVSDLNKSNKIEPREACLLALAVSVDAFCIGMASGILGLSAFYFPLFVAIFHIIFLQIGMFFGRKINKLVKLPTNIWSIISGLLLICIGFSKLFIQ